MGETVTEKTYLNTVLKEIDYQQFFADTLSCSTPAQIPSDELEFIYTPSPESSFDLSFSDESEDLVPDH